MDSHASSTASVQGSATEGSTPPSPTALAPSQPTPRRSFLAKLGRALPWIIWPLLATAAWLSTILGLLIWWGADGTPRYLNDQQTILYVSDVGAKHDDLFIAGSVLTALFYAISLVLGRFLRHLRRLPGVVRRRERVAAIISIVCGWIGAFWLIMLSIFNNRDHSTAHWTFAALFLAFIAISALAQVLEVHWLSRSHPDRRHLRRNSIIKMIIIGLANVGALLFIITYAIGRGVWESNQRPTGGASVIKSVAAVFEWTVALIFTGYLFTFVLDLWPAHKTRGLRYDASLVDADRAPKEARPAFSEMREAPGDGAGSVSTVAAAVAAAEGARGVAV